MRIKPMRHKLFKKERNLLAERFPTLTLRRDKTGGGRVTGVMDVRDGVGYSVNLVFSNSYPDEVPVLFCREEEIDWTADRHVYPDSDGLACLCVPSEYRIHWPPGSTLADFLTVLVLPYLVGQAYYDAHGHWPAGQGRSHGSAGIVEAYEELFELPKGTDGETVIGFMRLIARPNHPKGTMECPCGSGQQLRHCHGALVARRRKEVGHRDAKRDLDHVLASVATL